MKLIHMCIRKSFFKAKEYLKTEVVILFYFDCSCEPELFSKLWFGNLTHLRVYTGLSIVTYLQTSHQTICNIYKLILKCINKVSLIAEN